MFYKSLRCLFFSPGFIQFAKFSIVGFLNVTISTIVFYLCYEQWHLGNFLLEAITAGTDRFAYALAKFNITSIDGAVASFVGYFFGMINSFLLNKIWTFSVRETRLVHLRRFVVLNLIGLAISTLTLFILVDMFGAPHMPVWFVTISVVMLLNFFGNKYWTFQ